MTGRVLMLGNVRPSSFSTSTMRSSSDNRCSDIRCCACLPQSMKVWRSTSNRSYMPCSNSRSVSWSDATSPSLRICDMNIRCASSRTRVTRPGSRNPRSSRYPSRRYASPSIMALHPQHPINRGGHELVREAIPLRKQVCLQRAGVLAISVKIMIFQPELADPLEASRWRVIEHVVFSTLNVHLQNVNLFESMGVEDAGEGNGWDSFGGRGGPAAR